MGSGANIVEIRNQWAWPGTVSTGAGDNGGVSYGSYQLSTNMRTINEFLRYNPEYGEKFKGLKPGTDAFNNKWRALAKADPTGFHDAQHDFIKHSHYDVQVERLKEAGIDLSQRGAAVQDMLWSTSVQFRDLTKGIVTGALKGKDLSKLSDADIVSAVQDYKRDHNDSLFSKSKDLWPGLLKRAANEKQDLLDLARSYGGDKAPTQKVSLSPEQERTLQQFKDQAGPRLAALGLSREQIDTVGQPPCGICKIIPERSSPETFWSAKTGPLWRCATTRGKSASSMWPRPCAALQGVRNTTRTRRAPRMKSCSRHRRAGTPPHRR